MSQIKQDLREMQVIGHRTRECIVPATACPTLGLYGITSTGLSEARDGFEWVRPCPSISVVLACVAGHGRVLVDGRWQTCGEGSIYLAPPDVLHAYHTIEGSRWDLCWVIYEQPRDQTPVVGTPAPALMRFDPWPLHGIIQGLYREFVGAGDPIVMHHWAELLHFQVKRMTQPWHRQHRLWRLWEAVDADLARPWTVRELATVACMSGEYLRTLCHRHLGRTPGQHVAYLRMQRAAALLKTTDWTIEAIAHTVGYNNPFAFSTAFRRWMHLPPSAYRSRVDAPLQTDVPPLSHVRVSGTMGVFA